MILAFGKEISSKRLMGLLYYYLNLTCSYCLRNLTV